MHRLVNRSRMSGDVHVRFCEGLRGWFPRATRLVIMARYQGQRLREFTELKIESWLGLELNQTKTKVVNLQNPGESFDFLGYTFRYDKDLRGRNHRYLNPGPSKKALNAEREKIRALLNKQHSHVPPAEIDTKAKQAFDRMVKLLPFGISPKIISRNKLICDDASYQTFTS